jgi:hypothetical protein
MTYDQWKTRSPDDEPFRFGRYAANDEEATAMKDKTNGYDAIDHATHALDAVLDVAVAQRNAGTLADPAPTDADLVLRRMTELMTQASDGAIGDLRRLRDDVDACIRSIQAKHAELAADFEHHVACVVEAIRFRAIAAEHLDNVRARFAIPTQSTRAGS